LTVAVSPEEFKATGRPVVSPASRIMKPEACPALVLNADFRPLSYYPLSLWPWQEAVKAVFLDRVNILSEYDTCVHSPTTEFRLPSVVSLKTYVKPQRNPAFTRFNVFLRDRFECQYCGSPDDLTFDHVMPALARRADDMEKHRDRLQPVQSAQGRQDAQGQRRCSPVRRPIAPTVHDLQANGRQFPPNYLHESWMDFLYWDTELDP
jgi:5-methylcytosine-specific restriction endonuclease McrA